MRGTSGTMRVHWAALLLVAVVCVTAGPAQGGDGDAGAADPPLRWLVAPDDSLEAWTEASSATWSPERLRPEAWTGAWPPGEGEGGCADACAYFTGTLTRGSLVIHDGAGPVRQVPVELEEPDEAQARRAVLLILRSVVDPLAAADGGWLPPGAGAGPAGPVEPPAEPVDVVDLGDTREEPVRVSRFWLGLGLGASGRVGTDAPAMGLDGRVCLVLGPVERSRLRLFVEVEGQIGAFASVGEKRALIRGLPVVAGAEIRLGGANVQVPIALGAGVDLLWSRRDDAGGDEWQWDGAPRAQLSVGVDGAPVPWLRIGVRAVGALDLQRNLDPIQIVVDRDPDVVAEVAPWSVGGQVVAAFRPPVRVRP